MSLLWVRPAQSSDLVVIAAIYGHWLPMGTSTFDVVEPPLPGDRRSLTARPRATTSW